MVKVAIVGTTLVGVATRTRPEVLTIPSPTIVLRDGLLSVNLDQVSRVVRVLMEQGHGGSGVAIFEKGVVVDDVVEGLPQLLTPQAHRRLIVILRRRSSQRRGQKEENEGTFHGLECLGFRAQRPQKSWGRMDLLQLSENRGLAIPARKRPSSSRCDRSDRRRGRRSSRGW